MTTSELTSIGRVYNVNTLFTIKSVARIKGCTPNAVYAHLERNDVQTYRIGRSLLVDLGELADWTPQVRKKKK